MNSEEFFLDCFEGLTGYKPFPWQKRLFQEFIQGTIPSAVDLATGTGKTSVMHVWLIALGWQSMDSDGVGTTIPRRLVWVVNRRVVVDQATSEADNLIKRINASVQQSCSGDRAGLPALHESLKKMSYVGSLNHPPLAISTLRGEHADNGEWKIDPSRPSIIIGTVDMVGSRLLFSGYGDGRWKRPHHAGLLGVDTLLVHDESQLSPSFQTLLDSIKSIEADRRPKSFHVMNLSATQRNASKPFILDNTDLTHSVLSDRLNSKKAITFESVADKKKQLGRIVERALNHEGKGSRVIVFVRSPKAVRDIVKKLSGTVRARVASLTGTMRGYERDQLVTTNLIKAFQNKSSTPVPESLYLVSTSAGEVGIDLNADQMVCDLTSLESMIQRFGRLNRFGGSESKAHCVYIEDELKSEKTLKQALLYLQKLPALTEGYDISPRAITAQPPNAEDFSPAPPTARLQSHVLDAWSLTSILRSDWPLRPDVELWLHGLQDELPETRVAWRNDVVHLSKVQNDAIQEVLEGYPLATNEMLRVPTNEALDQLKKMALRSPETRFLIQRTDGTIWKGSLTEAVETRNLLEYTTVILPSTIGGFHEGMLDGSAETSTVMDVADMDDTRRRYLATSCDGEYRFQRLGSSGESDHIGDLESLLKNCGNMRIVGDIALSQDDDGTISNRIIYLVKRKSIPDGPLSSAYAVEDQTVADHNARVARVAAEIATRLGLTQLVPVFKEAGIGHDLGKGSPKWQLAIGQRTEPPLAKTTHGRFNHRLNGGYRHEFGSIIRKDFDVVELDPHEGDLVHHLIATHHGHGRPGFSERAFDRDVPMSRNDKAQTNTLHNFAILQRRFGRWGLAYLEAILKASDTIVSLGIDRGES